MLSQCNLYLTTKLNQGMKQGAILVTFLFDMITEKEVATTKKILATALGGNGTFHQCGA
jgi:hypothetical protein